MRIVAGVDEVGRGSLIGPVYAAAVILNKSIQKNSDIEALKNGCISVTPISINHTDTAFKNSLENYS